MKQIEKMPSYFRLWTKISDKESCMYSDVYHFNERLNLSEWEIANNPWWIDFPAGSWPEDEKESYNMHAKGALSVAPHDIDGPHLETDMAAALETALESRLEDEDQQTEDRVPRQRLAKVSRKGKEQAIAPVIVTTHAMAHSAKRPRESFEFMKPLFDSSKSNSKVQ